MNRFRIVSVIGTRPEAIKMAPVILELRKHRRYFEHSLVCAAQHRQMLDQVLKAFQIKPDVDLGLMRPNQNLAGLTARATDALTDTFAKLAPDLILIQGDTTTVMSAALAAFYLRIPIGHVEAGLRTFDRFNPFPEEVNRRIVSTVATYHFAPTGGAKANLLREGQARGTVFVTGNTIVDAIRLMPREGTFESEQLRSIPFQGRRLLLVTSHRRENHGAPLRSICAALRTLAEEFEDVEIVYPVHLNPAVVKTVRVDLGKLPRIHLVEPVSYTDLLKLMALSCVILTDSGGIQEEAPSFRKPVLVLRETTERPEVIEVGAGKLVGTDARRIVAETRRLLTEPATYTRMTRVKNPFGDGHAARRIVAVLRRIAARAKKGNPRLA